jgi:hypothetical protein
MAQGLINMGMSWKQIGEAVRTDLDVSDDKQNPEHARGLDDETIRRRHKAR